MLDSGYTTTLLGVVYTEPLSTAHTVNNIILTDRLLEI